MQNPDIHTRYIFKQLVQQHSHNFVRKTHSIQRHQVICKPGSVKWSRIFTESVLLIYFIFFPHLTYKNKVKHIKNFSKQLNNVNNLSNYICDKSDWFTFLISVLPIILRNKQKTYKRQKKSSICCEIKIKFILKLCVDMSGRPCSVRKIIYIK